MSDGQTPLLSEKEKRSDDWDFAPKPKKWWVEFRQFIFRGSVVDLAIAVIIGNAFQAVVTSLAKDVLMPPIGLAIGNNMENWFVIIKNPPNWSKSNSTQFHTPDEATKAGAVTLNQGKFFQTVVNFIVISAMLFVLLKLYLNSKRIADRLLIAKKKQEEKEEAPKRNCPRCYQQIDARATRCHLCTSEVEPTYIHELSVNTVDKD